jgi:hypothetical protein
MAPLPTAIVFLHEEYLITYLNVPYETVQKSSINRQIEKHLIASYTVIVKWTFS